jgi:tetratricopeptide (TPR) repeat protein
LSAEELAALEEQAESQLADLLQQRAEVEARSAASWAAEDWARYEELSRAGDDALLAHDYRNAVTHYTAAHEAGLALLERSGRIVSSALTTAADALSAGDARLAREQYELVLGIEPTNAHALAGRTRAERLPEVIALVQRAGEQRQSGALDEAAALYAQALEIDSEWGPASAALAEVRAEITAARFGALLSRGFAALADEDYEAAQEHFRAALELQPRSASAADGLAQAEQRQKLDAIALAEARALAFERRELWNEAIEVYATALTTDSTLAFAISGLERARSRADLDSKLENLIANPGLLLTDSVLVAARRLVDEARAFAESNTRIAGQVGKIDELVRVASTPISVLIESDALTEVTVYRVGELGTFMTREIQVRPGTYTAVGSRDGYRDVRETFTVLPGRDAPTVHVACSEPI